MDEMLKEIRNAEEKAKNIIAEAERKKEIIIKNAEEESKKIEIDDVNKYEKKMEKKVLKEGENIRKEGDVIKEDGKKKASRLLKKAESNLDSAVSLLLKKFEEMVE